jgi:hypothetical protein
MRNRLTNAALALELQLLRTTGIDSQMTRIRLCGFESWLTKDVLTGEKGYAIRGPAKYGTWRATGLGPVR